MRVNTLLMASAAALGMLAANSQAQEGRLFDVKIHKVEQRDNVDSFDALGADRADLFAQIWVNGKEMGRTKNVSKDEAYTYWRWNLVSSARYVSLKIRLKDDDGGLENKDDHMDINPMSGKKDIDLIYDTVTGTFTGDLSGSANNHYTVTGKGDSMRGELTFSIDRK